MDTGIIGLYHHKTKSTKFYLCVDDFSIKYWSKENAQYLCNAIGITFQYTVNEEEKYYCGLSLEWN